MSINELFDAISSNDHNTFEKGMKEADNVKYISIFFQPLESKTLWESCALVISRRTNEELRKFIIKMFEWLKDMNWPGASIIYKRLLKFSFEELEFGFTFCYNVAMQTKDTTWRKVMYDFAQNYGTQLTERISNLEE